MTAFTPNRGYPYPQSTDPADAPAQLQALAEAIDDDLESIETLLGTKPFGMASSNTPQILAAPSTTYTVVYDFQEIDTDDMVNLSSTPGGITINTQGLYWVYSSIEWPSRTKSGTGVADIQYDMFIRQSGVDRARRTSQGGNTFAPGTTAYLNARYAFGTVMSCVVGDLISVTVSHNFSGAPQVQLGRRELAVFKVAG